MTRKTMRAKELGGEGREQGRMRRMASNREIERAGDRMKAREQANERER